MWASQAPNRALVLVPDVDKGQLSVLVHGSAAARGLKVLVSIVLAHVMSVVGKAGTS